MSDILDLSGKRHIYLIVRQGKDQSAVFCRKGQHTVYSGQRTLCQFFRMKAVEYASEFVKKVVFDIVEKVVDIAVMQVKCAAADIREIGKLLN